MSEIADEVDYYPEPTCMYCGKVCDIFEIHPEDEQMWAWCNDCNEDTFHEPLNTKSDLKK